MVFYGIWLVVREAHGTKEDTVGAYDRVLPEGGFRTLSALEARNPSSSAAGLISSEDSVAPRDGHGLWGWIDPSQAFDDFRSNPFLHSL